MSVLAKIGSFITGGAFDKIIDTAKEYFPPSMTEQDKLQFELALKNIAHKQTMEANNLLNEAGQQLDKRIAEQEGTAKDLQAVPFFGTLVLFFRGLQRPLWGFFTMYMDYVWLVTNSSEYTEQQNTALIVINILVLGFLFGERTLKNLEPLIIKVFGNTGSSK